MSEGHSGEGKSSYADYAPTPTSGFIGVPDEGAKNSWNRPCTLDGFPVTMGGSRLEDHCFVATCVYGDIDHPNVERLRCFRDGFLSKWWLGRKFISSYYSGMGLRLALLIQNRISWLIPLLKRLFDWAIPKLPQSSQFSFALMSDSVPDEIFDLPWPQVVSQIVIFLEKEAQKRDSRELIVPLSGGVDSCTVAALCRLTKLRVTAVTVAGEGFIREDDVRDAKHFCAYLGIRHEIIDLTKIFREIISLDLPEKIHLIMAFRSSVIKEYAEERNAVLVGGANKTERFSGLYCRNSIIGDIFPLEFFKTQIYQLAAFLGVPGYILGKASHGGIEGSEEDSFWGLGHRYFDWLAALIERGERFQSISQASGAPIELLETIQRQMKHAETFFSFPSFQLKE